MVEVAGTCEQPFPDAWCEVLEVRAVLPWRVPRVREWLRANDAGPIGVRTRAGAVDTDRLQVELRGSGTVVFTVFGLRLGRRVVGVIV